jgi:hypothetical protein
MSSIFFFLSTFRLRPYQDKEEHGIAHTRKSQYVVEDLLQDKRLALIFGLQGIAFLEAIRLPGWMRTGAHIGCPTPRQHHPGNLSRKEYCPGV